MVGWMEVDAWPMITRHPCQQGREPFTHLITSEELHRTGGVGADPSVAFAALAEALVAEISISCGNCGLSALDVPRHQ